MTVQNYCMVNESTNIVDNVCIWDGNTQTWATPSGYLMFVQSTTPAKNWVEDTSTTPPTYTLQVSGVGSIGYTWDGTYLTTNQPQPTV